VDEITRAAIDRRLTLRELEDIYVDEVLAATGGNKVQAARILGINRRTLYRRGERRKSDPNSEGEGS
jgi:DNA-binding NtrC family response regulator